MTGILQAEPLKKTKTASRAELICPSNYHLIPQLWGKVLFLEKLQKLAFNICLPLISVGWVEMVAQLRDAPIFVI